MEVGWGGEVVTPWRRTVKGKMVGQTRAAPPAVQSQRPCFLTAVRSLKVQRCGVLILNLDKCLEIAHVSAVFYNTWH